MRAAVTEHADTIRRYCNASYYGTVNHADKDGALAALDALVAERQQAIDALRELKDAVLAALTGCEGEITGERLQALNDAYERST